MTLMVGRLEFAIESEFNENIHLTAEKHILK
jgi:hypothetical protein